MGLSNHSTKKFSKTFHHFLTLFLFLAVLSTSTGISGLSVKAALAGNGTEVSPYLIKTAEDLYQMANKVSAHYKLENNINLENISRQPIKTFKGVLNGGGFTIKNLNVSGDSNVGLFAQLSGAVIKDLTIEDAVVIATNKDVGVLTGKAQDATLTNCVIKNSTVNAVRNAGLLVGTMTGSSAASCYITGGNIYTSNINVGGLVGYLGQSTLFQCYSTAQVESSGSNAGGLAGRIYDARLEQCFSTGSVTSSKLCGSLVGEIEQDYGSTYTTTIQDCYATGEVSTIDYAGGITYSTPIYTNIINCYVSAPIKGDKGVFYLTYEPINVDSEIRSSYFDSSIAQTNKPALRARSTQEMYKQDTYEGWDFETVWTIKNGKGYPQLRYAVEEEPIQIAMKIVMEVSEEKQLSVSKNISRNENVIWSSSNESVASVDKNGKVSALRAGTTLINCRTEDGKYEQNVYILVTGRISNSRLATSLKNVKSIN